MPLSSKVCSQITEADLLALIDDKEAESKTIDYKRTAVEKGDLEKKKNFYTTCRRLRTRRGAFLCLVWRKRADFRPTLLVLLASTRTKKGCASKKC
jgi:hypothetical protein